MSQRLSAPTHILVASQQLRPSNCLHPKSGRRVSSIRHHVLVTVSPCIPMSHPSNYHPHMPRHIPATAGTNERPMSHPVYSTSYPSNHRHLHPNVVSQRLPTPRERPTGYPILSTSRPSDRRHLHLNVTSQGLSPTHALSLPTNPPSCISHFVPQRSCATGPHVASSHFSRFSQSS
jgi:hypothetical protein